MHNSPQKNYRVIIFDWDGTLMDSTAHIVGALQQTCQELELPAPSFAQASWVIGMSLQAALYHLMPDLGEERVPLFIERYRHHFTLLHDQLGLFPGQADLLHDLQQQGLVLGIATGKSRQGLAPLLERLQLNSFFTASRCADEARGKPHPEMLHQLMDELAVSPDAVLMVGDTTHDVLMAQAAGVDSLAVAYGAHAPAELAAARPTAQVDTVPQMQAWLRENLA